MKYSLGHICYMVRDKQAALEFYRDKMGFQFMFEQQFPGTDITAIYVRVTKNQFIELIGNREHEQKPNGSFGHLCLHVDDIHASYRALVDKGLQPTPVEMGMANCLKFYIDDPDGNTIEMMQLLEDSLQTIHDHD